MSGVITTTDETFEQEVLKSDKPVLVDFTASWCAPCRAISPILDQIAEERDDIKIVKIDIGGDVETGAETNPETAKKYQIEALPTIFMFRNGKVAHYKFGGGKKDDFNTWIDATLMVPESNDMNAEEAAVAARQALQEQNDAMMAKAKSRAEKLVIGSRIAAASLKIVGAVGMMTMLPPTALGLVAGVGVTGIIGSAVTGKHLTDIYSLVTEKESAFDDSKTLKGKVLSTIFNAVTLAAGVLLMTVDVTGTLAETAKVALGGFMFLNSGIGLLNNLRSFREPHETKNSADTLETETKSEADTDEPQADTEGNVINVTSGGANTEETSGRPKRAFERSAARHRRAREIIEQQQAQIANDCDDGTCVVPPQKLLTRKP